MRPAPPLHELEHRHEVARTRLATLERALERGDGLPPAAQTLRAAGAKLVVAGVEAEPGYERAVAAALGWRAGAVVVERLDHALEMLRSAPGEVGVVVADAGSSAESASPAKGARRLADVVTVHDPAVARLVSGIWLVDDLAAVRSGVAVTVTGEGIDADRGEVWRTTDAGEAAWMAARSERDRVSAEAAELEQSVVVAGSRAAEAAAEAESAASAAAETRRAHAAAREADAATGDRAREAVARREALADELARADASRDLATRDLDGDRERLAELTAAAEAFEAEEEGRRTAATAADEHHARLESARRELVERTARVAAERAALGERVEHHRREGERLRAAAAAATAGAGRLQAALDRARGLGPALSLIAGLLAASSAAAESLRAPARAGVGLDRGTRIRACLGAAGLRRGGGARPGGGSRSGCGSRPRWRWRWPEAASASRSSSGAGPRSPPSTGSRSRKRARCSQHDEADGAGGSPGAAGAAPGVPGRGQPARRRGVRGGEGAGDELRPSAPTWRSRWPSCGG